MRDIFLFLFIPIVIDKESLHLLNYRRGKPKNRQEKYINELLKKIYFRLKFT